MRFFREQRSSSNGSFQFNYIAAGTYRIGITALGYEYLERTVNVSNVAVAEAFMLRTETNGGRWTIVGNTDPELLDGSGSGTLLPTGEIFFCHDTEEPIMFDPVSGLKWYPPDSLTRPSGRWTISRNRGADFEIAYAHGWKIATCPMSSAFISETKASVLAAAETHGRGFFIRRGPENRKSIGASFTRRKGQASSRHWQRPGRSAAGLDGRHRLEQRRGRGLADL